MFRGRAWVHRIERHEGNDLSVRPRAVWTLRRGERLCRVPKLAVVARTAPWHAERREAARRPEVCPVDGDHGGYAWVDLRRIAGRIGDRRDYGRRLGCADGNGGPTGTPRSISMGSRPRRSLPTRGPKPPASRCCRRTWRTDSQTPAPLSVSRGSQSACCLREAAQMCTRPRTPYRLH